YVLGLAGGPAEIIPIATATNTPEKAIKVGTTAGGPNQMAITPDGKTLYVTCWNSTGDGPSYVIPIATATNTPRKPNNAQNADVPHTMMTPDGRTAYAIGPSKTETEIIPIATATNTPGQAVSAGPPASALAITPDGQILYLNKYAANSGSS